MLKTLLLALACALTLVAPTQAADKPWTLGQVADLLDAAVPESLAANQDINPEDKYAAGIDVLSGPLALEVNKKVVDGNLLLFVRDGKIGALKFDQSYSSHSKTADPQALYEAFGLALLDSSVGPTEDAQAGGGTSYWNIADGRGDVMVSKGYDSQGLVFYFRGTRMHDSYIEFWGNWNKEIDEMSADGLMWMFL